VGQAHRNNTTATNQTRLGEAPSRSHVVLSFFTFTPSQETPFYSVMLSEPVLRRVEGAKHLAIEVNITHVSQILRLRLRMTRITAVWKLRNSAPPMNDSLAIIVYITIWRKLQE
jgi:hypothetical protein